MKRPGRRPGLSIRLLFRRSVAGGHGATGPIEPVVQADLGHPLGRSEEHTSELQSQSNLVCRLLLEKKKKNNRLMSISSQKSINDFRSNLSCHHTITAPYGASLMSQLRSGPTHPLCLRIYHNCSTS